MYYTYTQRFLLLLHLYLLYIYVHTYPFLWYATEKVLHRLSYLSVIAVMYTVYCFPNIIKALQLCIILQGLEQR